MLKSNWLTAQYSAHTAGSSQQALHELSSGHAGMPCSMLRTRRSSTSKTRLRLHLPRVIIPNLAAVYCVGAVSSIKAVDGQRLRTLG